ncbi:MAG TPA: ornithine carbamoyltransferase [Verrucomicrobiae bacterium]|jgi:ornithine carbamoyltransferase|nr:ornithine carbamoyltransferase [Verrucomicrobiae bacterium]
MRRHLISINDLKIRDIEKILSLAEEVKRFPEEFQNALRGHKFGLIFEKPSTRTWVSFDAGIFSLGGSTVYLGPEDIKLGEREEVRDVARVLDRYLAGIIMRTFAHETITEFEKYFQKPVINGLSDREHPCQALADYLTIREHFSDLSKPVVAFIGDGNNVMNSLLYLAAHLGGTFRYATPKKHEPAKEVLDLAQKIAAKTGAKISGTHDPREAAEGADVLYTDVWVSMGEEKIRDKKLKEFKGFQINKKLMDLARKKAIVMHCLPAHRGEEITDDVMESKNSVVFDQAENRLHIQKAVLLFLHSTF